MANTRHTYHLHSKEIEEIIRNNGLPEEISTETQLWDLIIKKATYSSPKLLFPLIYEIYGKKYPEDSSVVPLSTEYSVERSDTKEISTIKADLTFCVNESDIYHFECEITYNGMITIRMFEYDVHASLNYRPETAELVMLEIEIALVLEIVKDELVKVLVTTPTLSVQVRVIVAVEPFIVDVGEKEPKEQVGASTSDQ